MNSKMTIKIKLKNSGKIREKKNYGQWNDNTVEPVYNGHPGDLRNWPLNTGSLKILIGCGLNSCKETIGQITKTLSSNQYFKPSLMPTCNLMVQNT